MGRSSKDSPKICIFEEIPEAIFQLSVEQSFFHLVFMSVVAVVVQQLHHTTQDYGCRQEKRKYISIASLQELKELGKCEYFFRSL